jgi:hypothetical protein
VSSRIHLTRSAVVASVCAVLAVTTAGAAAARTSGEPSATGRVQVAGSYAVHGQTLAAARTVAADATLTAVAERTRVAATSTTRSSTTPTTKRAAKPAPRTATIPRYVDAPGSQRAIDACRLVLWTSRPMWLAGHNYCGYQWLAYIRTGTVVVVRSGRAAGRYVVTGHLRLSRQSGSLPRVHADLVLQTCVGRSTGLTLAQRLG